MNSHIKNAIQILSPSILFLCFGLSMIFTGDKTVGITIVVISAFFIFFSIMIFISCFIHNTLVYLFSISKNLELIDDCNGMIDYICFNKVYKIIEDINFYEGLCKDHLKGSVKKYLHGKISNSDGITTYGFYLLKYEGIEFPSFYSYNPLPFHLNEALITEADRSDPILTLECPKIDIKELEKIEKKNEEDNESSKILKNYIINGKNTNNIKQFFNKDVIKDFKELINNFDFIETKDNILILVSSNTIEHEKRQNLIEKSLPFFNELAQHIDDQFKNKSEFV